MRSGFVSLIGRPNTGKSTLLNTIINEKVAIVSDKAGTTRNVIQGIYNEVETQVVFVDTPGIGKPDNKLGKMLNREAIALTKDVDVILFVVDIASGFGRGDAKILRMLENETMPVILVLNKIDRLKNDEILKAITEVKDLYPFAEIVPLSAMKNDNVDRLISCIKKYLTDNIRYFGEEEFTSQTSSFMASELVREKLLNKTEEEVPHSLTCYTTMFENKKDIINISVDVIVDRDSLKKIIIGKRGEKLKSVGIEARADLERLFDKKVYLETYVKTVKNWKDKERYLKELGFDGFNE
ncbi:MAG: GTPase Era [bacterium]